MKGGLLDYQKCRTPRQLGLYFWLVVIWLAIMLIINVQLPHIESKLDRMQPCGQAVNDK